MKTTRHFEERIAERGILREWCERVVGNPRSTEIQPNGRTRQWGFIDEVGRWLRVVIEEDGETYHTALFDRAFGKRKRP